jgi:hypothetical protein
MTLMIGIPSKGSISTGLAAWLFNLQTEFSLMMNESRWVSNARNILTTIACETKEIDQLLFVDSDCFPAPDSDILSQLTTFMADKKADIVCVPYFMQQGKQGSGELQMVEIPKGVQRAISPDKLVEPFYLDGWAPFGFSLMDVDFLRKIWKHEFGHVTTKEAQTELDVPAFWGLSKCTHEDKQFGELMMGYGANMWLYPMERVYHVLERLVI